MLRIVMPVSIGLPDVERCASNRLSSCAAHQTRDVADLARRAPGHVGAIRQVGRIVDVEGAGHRRRRSLPGEAVIDAVDEHADTDHVGGQDEPSRLLFDSLPVRVSHSIAANHSASVGLMSRTKACRYLIIDCISFAPRSVDSSRSR